MFKAASGSVYRRVKFISNLEAQSFNIPFVDAGNGAVNTTPAFSSGSGTATFTRATTATTVLSDGSVASVATGVARSYYYPGTLAYGGYLSEPTRINAILQSNTLDTTWTVSNAADMNAVAADAYVSVDGTTTMDKLQPKATTAVHSLDQAFTFTAAQYTTAFDFRYVPATPQRWVAIICNDGTTTWGASFDLLNGVAGAVSAGATSKMEATGLANVYRCSVTKSTNAAAAAGTVKISLNATDTATLESAARAGTETLGAGMAQHEIGTYASSRITTTTIAVQRNADVLTYPSAGNIDFTQGAAYAELGTEWTTSTNNIAVATSGVATGQILSLGASSASTVIRSFDGTTTATKSGLSDMATGIRKRAVSWGAVGQQITGDGAAVVTAAFDGSMGAGANIDIGHANGASQWGGTIRNVRSYPKQPSIATLSGWTA